MKKLLGIVFVGLSLLAVVPQAKSVALTYACSEVEGKVWYTGPCVDEKGEQRFVVGGVITGD